MIGSLHAGSLQELGKEKEKVGPQFSDVSGWCFLESCNQWNL